MIPQILKDELFNNKYFLEEGIDLTNIGRVTLPQYNHLARKIRVDVYKKALNNEALQKKLRFPKKEITLEQLEKDESTAFISGPTLKSLLDDQDKRSNKHLNRAKSLNALMVFLEIPEDGDDEWARYKDIALSNKAQLKFHGDWYLYRYHYTDRWNKIKRTLIKILEGSGGMMNVQYHSLAGEVLTGVAQLRGRVLTITINHGKQQETKTIEITAAIASEDTEVVAGNVFNAIIRSSRSTEPYAKHCVMEYFGNKELRIEEDIIRAVYHAKAPPKDKAAGDILNGKDAIVEFLARKNRELSAKPFKRPLMDEITNRNKIAVSNERPGFDAIKTILQGKTEWYSFSPHNDGTKRAACNYFSFSFDEERKEVTYTCRRYENDYSPFSGYVEYFRNQLIFKTSKKDWKAYQNNSILYYSVGIFNAQTQRIYASTTLVIGTENLNRNLKEIFFLSDENMGENKIFPYPDFIKSKAIKDFEKHALIKMNSIYDDWPTIDNNILLNFSEIKKYAHQYLVFIVNGYSEDDKSLLQITLQIDQLGFTTETALVKYTDLAEPEITNYEGIAGLWKKTLKLRNKMVGGQKSEYIFRIDNIDDTDVTTLEGVTLDTDRYGLPCADRCFAIRYDKIANSFPKIFEFKSFFVKPDSESYKALNTIMVEKTQLTISEYFFEKFRSLREQRYYKKSL